METTLKPYPEYQDSGQEWLGQVPVHWSVLPNRALFREVKDQNHPEEPMLSVTISRGVIPQEVLLADSSKKDSSNLDKSKYKLVEPGDIAYNKMRAWQGALGVSEHRGIVSPAYIIVRPRQEVDPRYFHYLLRTPTFVKEAERWSYGITSDMWSLRYEDFKQIYCVLPPLDEQRQMARYLDQQFRHVGRLLRAKQRLIALLNEQKQAIIQRAVTRGLDPDVSLKPSGVDWLGDVPEHWDVSRIKGQFENLNRQRIPLSTVERGRMRSRKYDYYGASGVIDKVDDYLFDDDLILIAEDGANLVLRNLPLVIIARGKYWVNNHAHILKPRRGNLQYWAYLLESLSYRPWITGAAQPKLTQDRLMAVPIPAPPDKEQDDIVTYVKSSTSHLDEAVRRSRAEIDLIREYGTRLIADVVTGKLDVRGVEVPDVEDDKTPEGIDGEQDAEDVALVGEEA